MKNRKKENDDYERIDLDNRVLDTTNPELENSILKLINISEPVFNKYGHELDYFTRFIWICNLTSYVTDENLLNRIIEFLQSNFESKEIFNDTENYLKSIKEQYSTKDFVKIKAIYFSIRAKYIAVLETFGGGNGSFITLKIDLEEKIITHNFPFVERVLSRNFEIDYKENLKKIAPDLALKILNQRIEALRDLDFLYGIKISSEIRKYHKKTKVILTENIQLVEKEAFFQNSLLKNPHKNVFLNDFAFTLFVKMREVYKAESNIDQANYSFLYDIMKKAGLIICSGAGFVKVLASNFDVFITKIDSFKTGNKSKTTVFNLIKEDLEKKHGLHTV